MMGFFYTFCYFLYKMFLALKICCVIVKKLAMCFSFAQKDYVSGKYR